MKILATAAQMRELDRTAIEELGIPSLGLMETAALAVTEQVMKRLPEGKKNPSAAVFCGPGNNGGDGAAVARQLLERGVEVCAVLVGDRNKMTPDERAMEEKLTDAGGRLLNFTDIGTEEKTFVDGCDILVDALFGVGLCREVGGDFLAAIRWMNRLDAPTVACDIPSGVSADSGDILGEAVRAAVTVTFTCGKPGLWLGQGGPCAGRVIVAPIGIPEELRRSRIDKAAPARLFEPEDALLPRRARDSHKGDYGRLFILGGCEGYTGAPILAARAALRGGAGLVTVGVPREIYPIAAVKCDEAMAMPLPETYEELLKKISGSDVALIGPGLGRKPETEKLVRRLLTELTIPVVLDADGINALEGHIDILTERQGLTVLTPHDGEFRRLTGCEIPVKNRREAALDFAKAHGCVMILKGHNTITAAPSGEVWINATGNPGMAKGGSGDVLSGLLAALLGQKQLAGDPVKLCAFGVFCHGLAGDRCAARLGEYGLLSSDVIGELPQVMAEFTAEA